MKVVIAVLVVLILGVGGYLIYSQIKTEADSQNLTNLNQSSNISPTQALTPIPTTSPEEDLTALERDLLEITNSEDSFTEDIQGL